MARYVVIEFENNDAAEKLIEQLDRASKRGALYRVVGLFVKPRNICKCNGRRSTNFQRAKSGHSGVLYGRKYGWWVCTGCNRPRQAGHQLVNQLQYDTLFPDTGREEHEMIVTNLDIYGQDRGVAQATQGEEGEEVMAGRLVVIEFDDSDAADAFLENDAMSKQLDYRRIGSYVLPRKFCQCPDKQRQNAMNWARGKRTGIWLCKKCKKPSKFHESGIPRRLQQVLGYNQLAIEDEDR